MKIKTLLSVDLEDWYTSAYLRKFVTKNNICSKIVESTIPILDLFEKKNVKATFFVLGDIAEKFPDLIKKISTNGHEIASHGYSHTPLWYLTPEKFREELKMTNLIIEKIIKQKPIGFRAPYASLNNRTSWVVDILEEEGFIYDSSIFPMKTPIYGISKAPKKIYKISSNNIYVNSPSAKIIEVPFTVISFGFIKIPCTGGIYGRIISLKMLKYFLKIASKKNGVVNFYFHPWETFLDIPKINVPFFNKFVSYFNIKNYLKKVEFLLDIFECNTFKNYIENNLSTKVC